MGSDLPVSHPNAVERDGVLYVIGLRDGEYWLRRSPDCGRSWSPFSDGSLEKPVASASCQQRAALVKLVGQGRPLLACVPRWPNLVIYSSFDDGETWTLESQV